MTIIKDKKKKDFLMVSDNKGCMVEIIKKQGSRAIAI